MATIRAMRERVARLVGGVVPLFLVAAAAGLTACGDRGAEVGRDGEVEAPAGAEATPEAEPADLIGDLMDVELSMDVIRRLPDLYAALEAALDQDPALMERLEQQAPPTSLRGIADVYETEPAIRDALRVAGISAYEFATHAHFPSVYGTVIMVEAGLPVMMQPRDHHVAFVRANREELERILERMVEVGAIPEVPEVPEMPEDRP